MKKDNRLIALLQAVGLISYIALVAFVMQNAESFLDGTSEFLRAILFLTLFSTSALICGSITLGYPGYVLWKTKDAGRAMEIVAYTALFLVIFVFLGIALLATI